MEKSTKPVKARDIIVRTAADREYIDYICPKCGDIISQRLDWTRTEAEAAQREEGQNG